MLLDVVEDAIGNKLSQEEYPYVSRAPEETDDFSSNEAVRIASARTNRSTISWARKGSAGPDAGSGGSMIGSGMLGSVTGALQGLGLSSTSQGQGKRLIVFVIGGVTRSEMRAVHEVAKKTGKDVLLGSTVIIKPSGFLSQLRSMGSSA
eukprot:GHRR01036674.1.p1 GENE.GHRR01036674.1~~GHRR01036674.1.p1  ORF type:complete len:149 (+),score=42.13 GHRR01036674.1:319-765(+)